MYLVRAMQLESLAKSLSSYPMSFADASSISAARQPYVYILNSYGIVEGDQANRFLPDRPAETAAEAPPEVMDWNEHVIYEPVFRLGSNVRESIAMVKQVDSLLQQLPGLDCGSCGAPTCRARAEDIVRGHGSKQDCIHVLKRSVKELTASCTKLADEAIQELPDADARLRPLLSNLQKLGEQAALMDGPLTENLPEEQKQQLAARKAHTEETESPHPTQESQEETL